MNRKLRNEELNRFNIEEFKKAKKTPIVIVLDNIRSLSNIGTFFRTGDAFLIEKIYLCGITAKPPHREIQKTALGSTESVDWEYFKSTIDCVNHLKQDEYNIISIEQTNHSIFLNNYQPSNSKPTALIFGNEVNGVEQKVIDISDLVIEIPQYGTKHSLNVSVSAGIILWEFSNWLR